MSAIRPVTAPLFALVLGTAVAAQSPLRSFVERDVAAMGTWLQIEVTAVDRATALVASEAAVGAVLGVETRLSSWRPDSELALANASPVGEPFPLGAQTAADLEFAFGLRQRTGGAFDPLLGAVLDAYGLRAQPRWPTDAALAAARQASAADAIEVRERRLLRRDAAAWLSSDAFAKGIALDRAAEAAKAAGACTLRLDFGGQWIACGADGCLELAHPRERERSVATLLLAAGRSAATSGNGERRRRVDGRELGHLFDPRSGRPAVDFGSVTVVAANAALADAASTALFVLGVDAGLAMAKQLGVDAVFVDCPPCPSAGAARDPELRLRATAGLRGCLRPVAGVALTFNQP